MKIIEKIGDFIIKETNESERSYGGFGYTGRSKMDNFYIYKKEYSATKYIDEYIETADTLEEAINIVNAEQRKKDFNIIDFSKELNGKKFNWVDFEKYLNTIEIPYKLIKKHNYICNLYDCTISFDISEYSNATDIIVRMNEYSEKLFELKVVGVYER